jgi:hypothetical protein
MKKGIIAVLTIILMYSPIWGQNPLYFTFEQDTNYQKYFYVDSSAANNIWQIGKPHKAIFDSAYSFPNALVTDTLNTYPINNSSSIIIWQRASAPVIGLHFYYQTNTDTLVDFGKIEVSGDKGLTWTTINYWYGQTPVFSGNSKGWKTAAFEIGIFYFNLQYGDTALFKFSFTSDSIDTHKDGWMIDNLYILHSAGVGINEILNSNEILNITPNPFSQSTQITLNQSYHNIALAVYDIQGKQVAQQQYADSDKIQLSRNQLSNGLYFLKLTLDDKAVETGKIVVRE